MTLDADFLNTRCIYFLKKKMYIGCLTHILNLNIVVGKYRKANERTRKKVCLTLFATHLGANQFCKLKVKNKCFTNAFM